MSVDTISNFLTVIRNGLLVSKRSVTVQHSNMKQAIANLLKAEGYIKDYKTETVEGKPVLTVLLKYVNGESVIHDIKRVSKSGRRHYEGTNAVKPVIGGLGISVLSTSKGIMTDKQARQANVGGEVICHIW